MYLVKMRPSEIEGAVERNIPVLMAAGVMEYHGPHLPLGTDLLITNAICEEVEKRCECVVAPAFPYGTTLNWAGGSSEGEIDFEPEPFFMYVREIFRGLIKTGFRRIYIIQLHQGPDGLQSLCLRRAAAEVLRETVKAWGEGWGRINWKDWPVPGIFGMISIAGPETFSGKNTEERMKLNFAHAAKGETQFIMASDPETVCMEALEDIDAGLAAWLGDAKEADREEGRRWLNYCVEGWVRELTHKE